MRSADDLPSRIHAASALLALPRRAAAQTLDKIRKSGAITLGYIDGAAPFSYADGNGEPQGYSVELCRAVADGIAAQLKREGLKMRWVKLTIQNRIEAVRTRQGRPRVQHHHLDAVAPAAGRLQPGHLRRRRQPAGERDAEIGRLADLDGKRIAVIAGTTTERALREALERRKVKAELVSIKTRDEGLGLLAQGAGRRPRLRPHRADRRGGDERRRARHFKLLDQDFSIEQYALMLQRGDHDFRLAVNRVLARIYRSGEIEKIYGRWLGPLGPPSVLLSATYFIQSLSE